MTSIVVFGANGRAGRAIAAEAARRGHRVTAAVRTPDAYEPPADADAAARVTAVRADVTDAASVKAAALGHDVAVSTVADMSSDPGVFFPSAAENLVAGLPGGTRLLTVSLSTLHETAPGARLVDAADFPAEYRPFSLGHAAGLDRIQASALDWTAISPTTDFDHEGTPTGAYVLAQPAEQGVTTFADFTASTRKVTYADFAKAVVDEIENPRHRKVHIGISA